MRECPVCEEAGVRPFGKLILPFSDQLHCEVCKCRLRAVRGGLLEWLFAWLSRGLIAVGAGVALWQQSLAPFFVGVGIGVGIQLLSPLELDLRDAPSVRRGERIRAAQKAQRNLK